MCSRNPGCREPWKRIVKNPKPPEDPTYIFPPIIGVPPLPVDERDSETQNKFVRELYIKYPFLLPKEVPPDVPDALIQRGYTAQFEDLSTYQEDFGHAGPKLPELVGARGLSLPERDPPTVRLPGVPYMPRGRHPLSPDDAIQPENILRTKMEAKKIIHKKQPLPARISEYEDNYNQASRKWLRLGAYSQPIIYIGRKTTLPKEQ